MKYPSYPTRQLSTSHVDCKQDRCWTSIPILIIFMSTKALLKSNPFHLFLILTNSTIRIKKLVEGLYLIKNVFTCTLEFLEWICSPTITALLSHPLYIVGQISYVSLTFFFNDFDIFLRKFLFMFMANKWNIKIAKKRGKRQFFGIN